MSEILKRNRQAVKDLIGKVYGPFTVIAENCGVRDHRGQSTWICQCECGLISIKSSQTLREGKYAKKCCHTGKSKMKDNTEEITPAVVKQVINSVALMSDIFKVLDTMKVPKQAFFLALRKNPELNELYVECRKIRIEEIMEMCVKEVTDAESKLDLEKAKIKLVHYQWRAEKLIPEAYGNRVNIDINQVVDIRGALQEAKERAGIVEATYKVVENEEPKLIEKDVKKDEVSISQLYNQSVEDLLG